jgi:hypothetical protein
LDQHPDGGVLPVADANQLGRQLDTTGCDTSEPGACC